MRWTIVSIDKLGNIESENFCLSVEAGRKIFSSKREAQEYINIVSSVFKNNDFIPVTEDEFNKLTKST